MMETRLVAREREKEKERKSKTLRITSLGNLAFGLCGCFSNA